MRHGPTSIVLTTNAGDGAVKPETVEAIVSEWQDHGADAWVYEWPAEWNLGHNMVDDEINADRFDEVHPILIEFFTEGRLSES